MLLDEAAQDTEGRRISMSLVEAIGKAQNDYHQSVNRQQKLLESLKEKRSDRLKNQIKENASIINLVQLWKEEESREKLIKLAELRKQVVSDEVERLSSMDEVKARILGLSEDEALSSVEHAFGVYPDDQHNTAKEYIKELSSRKWSTHFTFSFVRNPWDRIVSWYLWTNRSKFWYDGIPDDDMFPQMSAGHGDSRAYIDHGGHPQVKENWYLNLKPQFLKFLKTIESTNDMSLYTNIYKNNNKGRWVANQTNWLKNNKGEIDFDFIGRFENLQEDFDKVCDQLDIDRRQLVEAKKLNKKPHYSKFYDSKSIELVRELYQEDIEYFNYEFEDRKRAIA
jgi:hypothetical protein